MGKKEFLANVLLAAGVFPVVRNFPAWMGNDLRLLAYHRVFDVADESNFPFDPELISASTADFQAQIEHVATYFVPVTCADVLAAIGGGRALPRRAIVITFDDGHADNYTHAFPVLRRLGVPATIFLSTAYIGEAGTFWFDNVANTMFRAPRGSYRVPGLNGPLRLADVASRRLASDVTLRHLKELPDTQRRDVITSLNELLKTDLDVNDSAMSGAMSWDQVREMASTGIEFGSHTVSHPVLTQLDDVALDRELVESRETIAAQIGRSVDIIAYPVGGPRAFDSRVIAAVQRAGYRLGLSYVSGVNQLHRFNRFAVRRLHVERYTSRAQFHAMLEFPAVFK